MTMPCSGDCFAALPFVRLRGFTIRSFVPVPGIMLPEMSNYCCLPAEPEISYVSLVY
jgi:hypothetical protein